MSRIFAYARVSTVEQTTDNQLGEIRAAGFQVQPRRIVTETISGSIAASERPGFARLIDRLEEGDILVVTKLDRLGRNAMDVRKTVDELAELGIKVHCLALGGVDLTSPAGRMTMGVINAVAEFERDLLIERTQAGLERAKAEGKVLGRPPRLTPSQQQSVVAKLAEGISISRLARDYGVSRLTITRARDKYKENPSVDGDGVGGTPQAETGTDADGVGRDGGHRDAVGASALREPTEPSLAGGTRAKRRMRPAGLRPKEHADADQA